MNVKLAGLFVTILMFAQTTFALTPEEVACNQSIEARNAAKALTQSETLLKSNQKNAAAWICQGRAYNILNKEVEALHAYQQAETHANAYYDKAVASLLAGHTYKHNQKSTEAIARYQQTIVYADTAKNKALALSGYANIGDVYVESKQLNLALEAYLKANEFSANDNERGETLEKIAATYHALKQDDLALEYQLKAQILMEKVGTLDQYAGSTVTLGRYYILNKNYDNAERILNKIIKFSKDQGGAYYEAQGSYVLAQLKAAKNDLPAAKVLVDYAKSIAKTTHDAALEDEINQETNALF
jgi:tetratricopeptide (TPR) repeat protein